MAALLRSITFFITIFASQVIAKEELRIVVHIEPPFSDVVNGEFVGRNVDVARVLAEKANYHPVFIECPFARCMTMIKLGQADMVMGIRETEERRKVLTYLKPAFFIQHVPVSFFTLKGSETKIKAYEDLKQLTVGSLRGITYFDRFDNDDQLNKVEVSSIGQLINLLKKNRIDTFLEREESVYAWIDEKEYQQVFALADYQYDKSVSSYIGISNHSKIINDIKTLSMHLKNMVEDGIVDEIYQGYNEPIKK